jgi:hypothetical protein
VALVIGPVRNQLAHDLPTCPSSSSAECISHATLSVAFLGWVENVGWGVSKYNQTVSHTANLGRDKNLALVQAQRAMKEGWMVLWGLRWEET